jgi:hypothetical protein
MIIADIGQYGALRGYVINLIQEIVRKLIRENRHNLTEILNLYSEEEINNAIELGIRRAGNKVFVQTSGGMGRILRSLEYGTGNTKALHILTLAARKVIGGRV